MKIERIITCCDIPYDEVAVKTATAAEFGGMNDSLRATWTSATQSIVYEMSRSGGGEDSDEDFQQAFLADVLDKVTSSPED